MFNPCFGSMLHVLQEVQATGSHVATGHALLISIQKVFCCPSHADFPANVDNFPRFPKGAKGFCYSYLLVNLEICHPKRCFFLVLLFFNNKHGHVWYQMIQAQQGPSRCWHSISSTLPLMPRQDNPEHMQAKRATYSPVGRWMKK